ncbi:uncharacterized protein LOC133303316 [Gastrolobium bilobum]|uniref:uncharacterized protein LOC133303316 n=1 Tax=Gastrolobium bilobum TaxID=150636 RepID=UPI002AB246C2|nr:uncharacterized protein LOC133303316 [Gastrolobium bilobum]
MAIQAIQASSSLHSYLFSSSTTVSPSILATRFQSLGPCPSRKSLKLNCNSNGNNDEKDYLLDAPVSVGDGFSFSGGKYSDGPSPSDEWFKQGKMIRAYSIPGTGEKAKDPIFGLPMGASSQATGDRFRWFCVESGSADNPSVILIHGFPSQVHSECCLFMACHGCALPVWHWTEAYSYRKVLPILSKDYHAIAFDWLGFGFSDKPQPRYGFDYTLDEYVSSLESLIDELAVTKVSLVVQGYFSPVVVKYASKHQEKLNNLILLNPPFPASIYRLRTCLITAAIRHHCPPPLTAVSGEFSGETHIDPIATRRRSFLSRTHPQILLHARQTSAATRFVAAARGGASYSG